MSKPTPNSGLPPATEIIGGGERPASVEGERADADDPLDRLERRLLMPSGARPGASTPPREIVPAAPTSGPAVPPRAENSDPGEETALPEATTRGRSRRPALTISAICLVGAAAIAWFFAPDVRGLIKGLPFVAAHDRPIVAPPSSEEAVSERNSAGSFRLKEGADPASVEVLYSAERPVEPTAPASSGAAAPPIGGPVAEDEARSGVRGPADDVLPGGGTQVLVSPPAETKETLPAQEESARLVKPEPRATPDAAETGQPAMPEPPPPGSVSDASSGPAAVAKTDAAVPDSLPTPLASASDASSSAAPVTETDAAVPDSVGAQRASDSGASAGAAPVTKTDAAVPDSLPTPLASASDASSSEAPVTKTETAVPDSVGAPPEPASDASSSSLAPVAKTDAALPDSLRKPLAPRPSAQTPRKHEKAAKLHRRPEVAAEPAPPPPVESEAPPVQSGNPLLRALSDAAKPHRRPEVAAEPTPPPSVESGAPPAQSGNPLLRALSDAAKPQRRAEVAAAETAAPPVESGAPPVQPGIPLLRALSDAFK